MRRFSTRIRSGFRLLFGLAFFRIDFRIKCPNGARHFRAGKRIPARCILIQCGSRGMARKEPDSVDPGSQNSNGRDGYSCLQPDPALGSFFTCLGSDFECRGIAAITRYRRYSGIPSSRCGCASTTGGTEFSRRRNGLPTFFTVHAENSLKFGHKPHFGPDTPRCAFSRVPRAPRTHSSCPAGRSLRAAVHAPSRSVQRGWRSPSP